MSNRVKLNSKFLGLANSLIHGKRTGVAFFKRQHDKIFPPKLIIQRKGIPQRYYQGFNIYSYSQQVNQVPNYFCYISGFFIFMYAGFYLALSQYDQDVRYFMFIRFPESMNLYDQICKKFSEGMAQIQEEYVGEIPHIENTSDYYNFKEQVKDKLFDIQEKERLDKEKRIKLSESAKDYDSSVQSFGDILSQQDKVIKQIQHKSSQEN